ncbi:ComEC/Rec2 family competence protein [Lacinutrix chionoecetis]
MEFEINMINVKDGDAIIIMLKKNDKKALILIDGGYKKHYPKIKKRLMEILPEFNNRIDLLICTHYDNDHIGGVEKILDDYHNIIQEIWIHKIADSLTIQNEMMRQSLFNLEVMNSQKSMEEKLNKNEVHNSNLILEGYKDLIRTTQKIVDYGLEDKTKEVTKGDYLRGFKEFQVISPTAEYYNSYLDELKDEKFIREIPFIFYENNMIEIENSLIPPCEQLEKSSITNHVTATNMVSIVTLLKTENKKLLFTGDAGIETFEKQNLLNGDLRSIDWLDLPHHGSKNNTSLSMLEHFDPQTVFVSAKYSSNRPSKNILKCLAKKRAKNNVIITNQNKKTWYLKFDNSGKTERVEMP